MQVIEEERNVILMGWAILNLLSSHIYYNLNILLSEVDELPLLFL